MLHHTAACRESAGSVVAVSWIHINPEEEEVLASE